MLYNYAELNFSQLCCYFEKVVSISIFIMISHRQKLLFSSIELMMKYKYVQNNITCSMIGHDVDN